MWKSAGRGALAPATPLPCVASFAPTLAGGGDSGWLAFEFEQVVQCGQVLREELIELFRHAVQFRFKVSTYPSWQSMPPCERSPPARPEYFLDGIDSQC
jgi:hypothetical protein